MKSFTRLAAMLLAVVLAGSMLTACSKGNDFTCADVINRSEDQQTWLKAPDSNLVLNPNAVGAAEGAADTRDMKTVPLSFGVKDASGNIVATYDDAFFILEYTSANGLGAEVIKQVTWDGCKGLSKVDNASTGTTLAFTIPDGFDKELQIRTTEALFPNYNDDKLYLSVNITSIPEGGSLIYNPYVICYEGKSPTYATWTAPGQYLINLQSCASSNSITPWDEKGTSTSVNLKASTPGNYRVTDFSIVRLGSGYQAAVKAPSTEWAPYYMKSTIEYPNNSSIETLDFFFGSNTVARKITPKTSGDLAFAGKIYGTCSYDTKENALTFDNGATKYVIFLKRKGTVEYYKTYEDLLSGENVLESADGASYWALLVNGLVPADDDSSSFYVAVAASDTMSIKDLLDAGGDAVSVTKAKKAFTALEEVWDAFIAGNDVSEYITVIPEKN